MDWDALLTTARLRRPGSQPSPTRSPFQQDADLVVFSAAFRRLEDKTQVQPLHETGRVRTRLTHSIEVASVGRSLGSAVAHELKDRRALDAEQCHAIAAIVHAACLAHDIGNPPFGHGGEDAIQGFFRSQPHTTAGLSREERADLCAFDGNAQGFRILTQLENYRFAGGLQLSHATLGAFLKYVVPAHARAEAPIGMRKPGFFVAEQDYVEELRASLALPRGVRHPLVYLTEAADDICYAIVDLEDGYDAGLVDHHDAIEILSALSGMTRDARLSRSEQIQKLRGVAIGRMIDAVSAQFVEREPELLEGAPLDDLCSLTEFGPLLAQAKALAAERIFTAQIVVERLLGGQRILTELLSQLVPVASALEQVGFERQALRGREASVAHLLGEHFAPKTRYEALLGVTDHLSALTDRAAVALWRRLSGGSVS
jgi:dGTPase